ncbi:hypothetical protein D9619_013443 [Psilocybe cf. subviscida]|uniref:Uncharacterized protein n=1 Tax=Psilocybe cf. subviscida TaxID=2480587 RepID=A0A8H5BTS5_9AGAR|nr:hypothetical protein D9619_013443 [Psilocybe cf. subviscida]
MTVSQASSKPPPPSLYIYVALPALALQATNAPASSPAIPASCNASDETLIPKHAQVGPANSVILEVAHITSYRDAALKAPGLHTEARMSFIT